MLNVIIQGKLSYYEHERPGNQPVRPHMLHERLGSIVTDKGALKTVVDFWLGHEEDEMAKAYQKAQFEGVICNNAPMYF